jgi:hypothetical protein
MYRTVSAPVAARIIEGARIALPRAATVALLTFCFCVCGPVLHSRSLDWIVPAGAQTGAPAPNENLLTALSLAAPSRSSKANEDLAVAYGGARQHKAIAVNAANGATWRVANLASQAEAEENVLESCEVFSRGPCALIALDDAVRDGKAAEDFPPREMPRVHYAGPFDPVRMPYVQRGVRERADVTSYVSAPAPKAAAYHPTGRLFIVTAAAAQRAAEEQALSACNGDPARNGANGVCYLYAAGTDVVLGRHLSAPLTPAAPGAAAATNPASAPRVPLKDAIQARLTATSGGAGHGIEDAVQSYLALKDGHKAIAAATMPPFTIATAGGLPTAPEASLTALERCQLLQHAPCTPIAVDNALPPAPPQDGKWPLIESPRLNLEGPFNPGAIPGLAPADRARADVAGYLRAPTPKAAALSAGKIAIVSGAPSQREAERQALVACGGGCYLYAVNSKVVLSQRLTEPRAPGKSLGDVLSYAQVNDEGAKQASKYEQEKTHKSLAILPESGRTFSFQGAPSAEMAQQLALEACEMLHNAPCVTVATDLKVMTGDPSGGPRRTMPRVTYQGPFRPDMVPLSSSVTKEAHDYATLSAPKAMAIRALGPKFKVATGRTLAEAEAKALAACNDDAPYPCILYAANDKVILPQRRTEAEP